MDRVCTTAAPKDWKMPPRLTVAFPPSVNDRAVVGSYCKMPPLLTVTLRATAVVSIVTVVPVAITASSAEVGTCPHDQIPGLLQLPEVVEVQVTRGFFGRAGGIGTHSSALCIAACACHACHSEESRRTGRPSCCHTVPCQQ